MEPDANLLEQVLASMREAPRDRGRVEMIVARPGEDRRRVLQAGTFTAEDGLEVDNWRSRGSRRTRDGSAHPDMQVAAITSRFLEVVAGGREEWRLAGDQLIVDLDLSTDNLEAGDHLAAGEVVLCVTEQPHTGCAKFVERFGAEAVRLANSERGRSLRLRGMYLRVVEPGLIRVGDAITKLE